MHINKFLSFSILLILIISVLGCRTSAVSEYDAEIEANSVGYCRVFPRKEIGYFSVVCDRNYKVQIKKLTHLSSLNEFLWSKKNVYIERNIIRKSASAIQLADRVLRELSVDADILQSDGSALPLSGEVALQECGEILVSEQDGVLVVALKASTSYTITASLGAGRIYYDYILH